MTGPSTLGRRDALRLVGGAAAVLGATPRKAAAAGTPVPSVQLTTTTAAFDPVRPQAAMLISRAAKQIGLDIVPNPVEYNVGIQQVEFESKFDMFLVLLAGASDRIDPNVFTFKCYDSKNAGPGGFDWEGYKDAALDTLLEDQAREMDVTKRKALIFKAQEMIFATHARSPLVYPNMTQAYRTDRVRGLVPMMGEGIGSFWSDIAAESLNKDGYIRTGATNTLPSLNPLTGMVDLNTMAELRTIYDSLGRIAPDGSVQLWAAKSIDVQNPTTITVTLRDGMRFHDGKPVTADDVKFTCEYNKKWKAPYFAEALSKIESIDVTGPTGLVFHLSEPYAPVMTNFFGLLPILPRHIWENLLETAKIDNPLKYDNPNPVGSGPFRFDHWYKGSELKVSAFKDHFSPPKCAGILRIVYGSQDAMAAAIESAECDRTRYILRPSLMNQLKPVANVKTGVYPSHGFYDLSYNVRRPPFDDPALRLAVDLVLPRDAIRTALLEGYAANAGSVIGPANAFWHNPAVVPLTADVKKARDVLAKAGYSWNSDGALMRAG
jgi:peptide/nickel transport system substrate-binding protein